MKRGKFKNICCIIFLALFFNLNFLFSDNVFNIEIRNRSNNNKTNIISWPTNIKSSTNGWIVADQYIYLHYDKNHTIRTGWGLQIYTDNTTNIANPIYIGGEDPCGLVETEESNVALPLAWKICDSLQSVVLNPVERTDHSGFNDYQWHWMLDKASSDFVNEKEYIIAYNQGGIAWHEAVRAHKPINTYIYIAAKFDNAKSGIHTYKYKTSMLRLEEFFNSTEPKFLENYFYIYEGGYYDNAPNNNHYARGEMGTVAEYDDHCISNPHSGTECIKFRNGGDWGGVYYLEPYSGVGDWPASGPGFGYDLTGAKKIVFYVRADENNVHFKYGYGKSGDSCGQNGDYNGWANTNWVKFEIDLSGKLLSYVAGGFYFVGDTGKRLYFDDIRYEK